jgi:hypothetical protein
MLDTPPSPVKLLPNLMRPPNYVLIMLDNKIILFFVTRTGVGTPNSIFCAELKYVGFFPSHTRFLSTTVGFEENLYFHFIMESIYIIIK